MFSGEASPCVSCGISTSSQSKLSSCFAAKLAQDPRSRWHSTTAAASLSPSSRGSESSRAAEGKPCLCTAWGGRVRRHLPAWECHGLWRPGLCRQQGASFRCTECWVQCEASAWKFTSVAGWGTAALRGPGTTQSRWRPFGLEESQTLFRCVGASFGHSKGTALMSHPQLRGDRERTYRNERRTLFSHCGLRSLFLGSTSYPQRY